MIYRCIKELPISLAFIMMGSELYAKFYKNVPNYVAVSMIAVSKSFQGMGFMHKVLVEPFQIAKEKQIPCILDMDTELKVRKYQKCGMKQVGQKTLKNGMTVFTMEYREGE